MLRAEARSREAFFAAKSVFSIVLANKKRYNPTDNYRLASRTACRWAAQAAGSEWVFEKRSQRKLSAGFLLSINQRVKIEFQRQGKIQRDSRAERGQKESSTVR
jgi:hypothetical protein